MWIDKITNNKEHAISQFENYIITDTICNITYYVNNMKEFCKTNKSIIITRVIHNDVSFKPMECYANYEYNKNDVYSLFKMKGLIK